MIFKCISRQIIPEQESADVTRNSRKNWKLMYSAGNGDDFETYCRRLFFSSVFVVTHSGELVLPMWLVCWLEDHRPSPVNIIIIYTFFASPIIVIYVHMLLTACKYCLLLITVIYQCINYLKYLHTMSASVKIFHEWRNDTVLEDESLFKIKNQLEFLDL